MLWTLIPRPVVEVEHPTRTRPAQTIQPIRGAHDYVTRSLTTLATHTLAAEMMKRLRRLAARYLRAAAERLDKADEQDREQRHWGDPESARMPDQADLIYPDRTAAVVPDHVPGDWGMYL